MPTTKTHFPQVPVEVAKKVAAAESKGNPAGLPKRLKKDAAGSALANSKSNETKKI